MRAKVGAFFAALLLSSVLIGQQNKQAEIDLQAAIRTENVKADLKAAIKQYEAIVSKYSRDRAVAAQALLHMAECYQKLEDVVETQKVYERITREFADQKDAAAEASARLTSLRRAPVSTPRMTTSQVWSAPPVRIQGVIGTSISPDGRYFTYGGRLHDVVAGTSRPLETNDGEDSSYSRDGKAMAYTECHEDDKGQITHCGLRVVKVQAPSQFETLYDNPGVFMFPHDWTHDGKFIAVSLRRNDGTAQIGLVSTESGDLRVLRSVDWQIPWRMFITPDDKHVAFDLPGGDGTYRRDIFVRALDGSGEKAVVVDPAHDVVMGWSPDGRYLIFASERLAPSTSLWALPFANGQAQGAPIMLKRDLGPVQSMGITSAGVLYFKSDYPPTSRLQIASFDFDSEQSQPPVSLPLVGLTGSVTGPEWSPDGKYLAYQSNRPRVGNARGLTLVIHSLESGQARELHPPINFNRRVKWAPDGRSLILSGTSALRGGWGIFRIDAQTAEITNLVEDELCQKDWDCNHPVWSPDGTSIYYLREVHPEVQDSLDVMVREVSTRTTKTLFHNVSNDPPMPSPDGRYVAVRKGGAVAIVPAAGGPARELMTGNLIAWAPDSRSLLIASQRQVWRVSLEGEAHKVDTGVGTAGFSIHPDGRRIAFAVSDPQSQKPSEISVLENFLPTPQPAQR